MKIVECVKDDWNLSDISKEAIKNGARVPKIGEKFIVKGSCAKIDGYVGYKFEEFDWSEFDINMYWNIDKFNILSEEYIANHIDENVGECEAFELSFEIKDEEE